MILKVNGFLLYNAIVIAAYQCAVKLSTSSPAEAERFETATLVCFGLLFTMLLLSMVKFMVNGHKE
jgi:hypothetical protein